MPSMVGPRGGGRTLDRKSKVYGESEHNGALKKGGKGVLENWERSSKHESKRRQ